jgi:hypothetical protein
MVEKNVAKTKYSQFRALILFDLHSRLNRARALTGRERNACIVKIQANIALTTYLFTLQGEQEIDF